jgi:hypothetical protein
MKRNLALAVALPLFVLISTGQQNTASRAVRPGETTGGRTDVYHIHFNKAALGKAVQLGDRLKVQDTDAPMPGHYLVLRHQQGEDWDYLVVEHFGTKATVEANSPMLPASARDQSDWHSDTFVNGPAWPEFARVMGLGDQAAKTAGSVYAVSVYRAAPGHREQLEALLNAAPAAGSAGSIVLQHLEGGNWQYLSLERYGSWRDYADSEMKSAAEMAKGTGDWFKLREHAAYHTDTLTDRLAPMK